MPTTRSLSQVIFNHLPESLLYDDEQGLFGKVTNVEGTLDSSIDVNRLADRIRSEIDRWRQGDSEQAGTVNPDVGFLQPTDIEIIRPDMVEWEVFPYYFRCRKDGCSIWQYRDDLVSHQGHCHRCNSPLEQTRFVWIHHCGYLTTLAPGRRAHCKKHRERSLYLHDTGTFATSSWRCRECGHQAQIGFLECPQCNSTNPRPQPMRWNDPGVFSSVTFQMVNLNQENRQTLYAAPQRDTALRVMLSCQLAPGSGSVLRLASKTGTVCSQCGTAASPSARFCDQCGARLSHNNSNDQSIDQESALPITVVDDLVTCALLWDAPGTSSLRFQQHWNPVDRFGIADLAYIERFPVSLIGLGYRRQRSKRPATLCLFKANAAAKYIRVFTDSTAVEACELRLDADAVYSWLLDNAPISKESVETMAPQNAYDLLQILMDRDPSIEQLVLGLLHTVSHSYIIGLSWCSGMDLPSFSEQLLPGALATIVHAGDTSLGGLSSVFSQAAWQPLELAAEDLVACQLDPSCSDDDGGACVACIHLPLGCSMWNSALSRAYLFGGQTKEGYVIKRGFWER
jgi:hypothetical protein